MNIIITFYLFIKNYFCFGSINFIYNSYSISGKVDSLTNEHIDTTYAINVDMMRFRFQVNAKYHLFVGEAKSSGIRITCTEIDNDQQEYMNRFDTIHNCFIDCKSKSSKFDLSINNIKLLDQIKVDIEGMRSINRSFFYFILISCDSIK